MRDRALQILEKKGTFETIEFLAAQADPLIATSAFLEVVRHLYWKRKDIQRTVVMAQAGIQFGLTAAIALRDEEAGRAGEIRSAAKALAYDLGSFTWPGWDEPGIEIDAASLAFGREAARLNLRLAQELKKGPLPLSRAFWLVGAHDLARGEWESAIHHFAEAKRGAETAGAAVEVRLAEGYEYLAAALSMPDGSQAVASLQRVQEELMTMQEGGADCAAQLQTAWKVFGPSVGARSEI